MVGYGAWGACGRLVGQGAALAAIVLFLLGGCGGQSTGGEAPDPCPGVCERAMKCPGIPPATENCDDQCLENDTLAVQSGCHDLFLQSMQCSAKLADVCTAFKDCPAATKTYECEHAYCAAHRDLASCVNVP